MAQLRHLVSKETENAMWRFKDRLSLLSRDPLGMHRSQFVAYLEAKAEQICQELVDGGMPTEQAIKTAQVRLNEDVTAWKQVAKRKKEGRNGRKTASAVA